MSISLLLWTWRLVRAVLEDGNEAVEPVVLHLVFGAHEFPQADVAEMTIATITG